MDSHVDLLRRSAWVKVNSCMMGPRRFYSKKDWSGLVEPVSVRDSTARSVREAREDLPEHD